MNDPTTSIGPLVSQSPSACVHLYIAGDYSFNIDVLAGYISEKAGMPCHGIHSSRLKELCKIESDMQVLLLIDCSAKGIRNTCNHTCFQNFFFRTPYNKIICFNVEPNTGRDKKALKRGVDGVIYHDQSVSLFVKTIHAVMSGELWYPRRILEQHLIDNQATPCLQESREVLLTKREQEVLNLLTIGMSNIDISKALYISPHTVKTHVYNIFRKIQVTNRYEAAQWRSANQ